MISTFEAGRIKVDPEVYVRFNPPQLARCLDAHLFCHWEGMPKYFVKRNDRNIRKGKGFVFTIYQFPRKLCVLTISTDLDWGVTRFSFSRGLSLSYRSLEKSLKTEAGQKKANNTRNIHQAQEPKK